MDDAKVTAWLRCAGLSRFAPRFAAALVSPSLFLQLSPSDLDTLGVDGPADRKRLSDLIAELRRTASLPPLRCTPPRSSTLLSVRSSDSRPVLESLSDRNSSSSLSPLTPPTRSTSSKESDVRHLPTKSNLSVVTPLTKIPSNSQPSMPGPKVSVCVRKRPLSRKELNSNNRDVVTVNQHEHSLFVHELKEKVDLTKYVETHPFNFDRVFGGHVGNAAVYDGTARPLVDTLFSGGRATCFAYGQTGAGKTFTMAGDGSENPGLYTLAVRDVFERLRDIEREQWRAADEEGNDDFEPPDPSQVWISFFEIYASKLQDLLNRSSKLECREDSNSEVQIVGLSERLCEVEEDVLACIDEGSAARSTGVTGANDDSSRSHAIFQIELRHPPTSEATTDSNTIVRQTLLRHSKSAPKAAPKGMEIGRLCFIDLAGSERGSDTASSTRQTRMEGAEINKSLLALKECIRAMDLGKDHTPFRGSKLTQVLKASFMRRNCRTVMIANISPASSNVEHTLNTLRYSDRVKEIRKERSASTDGSHARSLGSRRATFSHGIGLRGGKNATTPMLSKTASFHNDPFEDGVVRGPGRADRKFQASQDRLPDVEDQNSLHRGMLRTTSGRRGALRPRMRPSDATAQVPLSSSTPDPVKRESRLGRRRVLKAPSMIPVRPSMGGSLLPKAPAKPKITPEERFQQSNSGLASRSSRRNSAGSTGDSSIETSAEELNRAQARASILRDAAKASTAAPTPMLTRRRARELEENMKKANGKDSEVPKDDPSEVSAERDTSQSGRKPVANTKNAAESAMNYYMKNRKDELEDEDILFTSADDLVEAADAAVSRLAREVETDLRGDTPDLRKSNNTSQRKKASKSPELSQGHISSNNDDESPSRSSEDRSSNGSTRAAENTLKSVVRMHHMQIEELMRLTEADVALVNAAENGEIDPQEYALKLSLNLSQKIDVVKTLQTKLKLLE